MSITTSLLRSQLEPHRCAAPHRRLHRDREQEPADEADPPELGVDDAHRHEDQGDERAPAHEQHEGSLETDRNRDREDRDHRGPGAGNPYVRFATEPTNRPLPDVLHELEVKDPPDTDDRYLSVAAKLQELGARCLIEDEAACTTIEEYALDWARNSKLGGPRGGYDDDIFWEETLTINMRLLGPMIAALPVAEQHSPMESSDREVLNRWLKRKVDQYEHGLRHLGYYKGG